MSDSSSESSGSPPTTSDPQHEGHNNTSKTTTTNKEGGVISTSSFSSLGVNSELCDACAALGWTKATAIQAKALPLAIEGRDIIGLAETGSGKTGAFAIPILQRLMAEPSRLFAVVLAPTRELAFQIHEVFSGLGSHVGAKSVCVVGGVDMMSQVRSKAGRH